MDDAITTKAMTHLTICQRAQVDLPHLIFRFGIETSVSMPDVADIILTYCWMLSYASYRSLLPTEGLITNRARNAEM